MKKSFFILILLFTINTLTGQGRLFTGAINFRNNDKTVNDGNHYYGYTVGLEGKLSEGFSPMLGAKYISVELQPSEKPVFFADKNNTLRMFTLSGGFTFPVVKTKSKFRIDLSILGTLTNVLDHDYDRMKELHGTYIEDALFGAGGQLSIGYKAFFIAIEGERQLLDAFNNKEGSYFDVYNAKIGISF